MALSLQTDGIMDLLQQQLDAQQQMLRTQETAVCLQRSLLAQLRSTDGYQVDSEDVILSGVPDPSTHPDDATELKPKDESIVPESAESARAEPGSVETPWDEAPREGSWLRLLGEVSMRSPTVWLVPTCMRPLHIDSVIAAMDPGRLREYFGNWLESQLILAALWLTVTLPLLVSAKPAETPCDLMFAAFKCLISLLNYSWAFLVYGTLISFQAVSNSNTLAWAKAARPMCNHINRVSMTLIWGFGMYICLWSLRLVLDEHTMLTGLFQKLSPDTDRNVRTCLIVAELLALCMFTLMTNAHLILAVDGTIYSGSYGNHAIPISTSEESGWSSGSLASALGGMKLGRRRLLAYYEFHRQDKDGEHSSSVDQGQKSKRRSLLGAGRRLRPSEAD